MTQKERICAIAIIRRAIPKARLTTSFRVGGAGRQWSAIVDGRIAAVGPTEAKAVESVVDLVAFLESVGGLS